MEFTAKGIPRSLRPAFQEHDVEKLDPAEHAFTVIERTLAYGNREELRWLFSHYGPKRLVAWIREAGWRRLSRRRLALWVSYFDLQSLPRKKGVWPY